CRGQACRGREAVGVVTCCGGEGGGGLGGDGGHAAVAVGAGVVRGLRADGEDGEPGHRVGGAEGALEQGVVEGGGGVVELLGEDALEDEAVDGGPGGGVDAGEGVEGGPFAR